MYYHRFSSLFNRETLCFVDGIRIWTLVWEVRLRGRVRSAFDRVLSMCDKDE